MRAEKALLTVAYRENEQGKEYFTSNIGPWGSGGTSTHPGHNFVFKRHDTKEVVCRFVIEAGTSVYYYDPYVAEGDDVQFVAKQGKHLEKNYEPRLLKHLNDQDQAKYAEHRFNLKFATEYRNFTGGSEWLAHYPKDPPLHKIWRADYIGQERKLKVHIL